MVDFFKMLAMIILIIIGIIAYPILFLVVTAFGGHNPKAGKATQKK
ncbi:MAG: hypothetical protein WC070_01215 [Candidatus Magasanikbacteria bacterium]